MKGRTVRGYFSRRVRRYFRVTALVADPPKLLFTVTLSGFVATSLKVAR